KIVQDVEAAKMFIDQLEMLEAKTKGNLSKQEEGLFKQALAALQMAFVEAVNSSSAPTAPGGAGAEKAEERIVTPKPAPEPESHETKSSEAPASAAADDSRKRFSKKY